MKGGLELFDARGRPGVATGQLGEVAIVVRSGLACVRESQDEQSDRSF
jgi:hypothetical protein